RRITDATHSCHHVAAIVVEEGSRLRADYAEILLGALRFPFFHGLEHRLEQVDVQAAAKTTISGHDDVADALHRAIAEIHVMVFRRRVGNVTDHLTDTRGVGLTHGHAILGPAHLAGRNHLHRTGNLLRVLD